MIVLYRCPTRTNVLCPCGAVERRLRKLGLEHETERRAVPALAPARDRGAHAPAPGAGAGRRRRGDPRLEANPAVPRLDTLTVEEDLSAALECEADGNARVSSHAHRHGRGEDPRPRRRERDRAGAAHRGQGRRLLRASSTRWRSTRPKADDHVFEHNGVVGRRRQGQHAVRLRLRGRLRRRPPGRRVHGQQPERRRRLRLRLVASRSARTRPSRPRPSEPGPRRCPSSRPPASTSTSAPARCSRDVSFKLDRGERMTLVGPQRQRQDDPAADARRRDRAPTAARSRSRKGARVALHDQRPPRTEATLREYVLAGLDWIVRDRGASSPSSRRDGRGRLRPRRPSTAYADAQARLEHAGGYRWRDGVESPLCTGSASATPSSTGRWRPSPAAS